MSEPRKIAGLLLLPHLDDIETRTVLKKLPAAHAALAELKGVTASMPNPSILVGTLSLQEAKESSEIENIITTQDDLYRSDRAKEEFVTHAAKEVHNYAHSLSVGYGKLRETGLITSNDIIKMRSIIAGDDASFRKTPGTTLKNDRTGEVIYTPPQHPDEIIHLMSNLEKFINEPDICDWDVLVKMAVMHHQFESIHPFSDGNGRTGRVLNILFLVQNDLLDLPVLYLSRYINQNKGEYYSLLQSVRDNGNWEPWLLYMIDGIEKTAHQTTNLVKMIKKLMLDTKKKIRDEHPKIYSQDLINVLFEYPYTKIDFMAHGLDIHRNTAAKYLDVLVEINILSLHKIGKENYYINNALFTALHGAGTRPLTN